MTKSSFAAHFVQDAYPLKKCGPSSKANGIIIVHRSIPASLYEIWRKNGANIGAKYAINYISKFGSINISEAEDILPEISRRSIQRKLKQLVDDGYLESSGGSREIRYILKDNHI